MHNGCLLLLAFVAVFQPIASYTERGLVDGRQQHCDYQSSVRDPGLKFHGTHRFTKPAVEERRLNHREDIRDVRSNEVREDHLRTASSLDRRLADSLERDRNTQRGPSRDRIGNDAVLRRKFSEAGLRSYRDGRNQEIRRERVARVQVTQQARSPSRRENSRAGENRYQRTDSRLSNEHRDSVTSRRNIRGNENNAKAQRVRENRDIRATINRVRDEVESRLNDRRLTREGVERMEMQRYASRIQLNGNTDREILGRNYRNRELSSSTMSHRDRVNRANNEGSRTGTREESTSLDRDDRRISSSRLSFDERRQMRDGSRIRLSAERRNILESASHMHIRGLQDRISKNRREARCTESQRENRDIKSKGILRTARSVDDRYSQDDSGSRKLSRENSVDIRRNVRDARSMERFRSLERSSESYDHARVLENLREIRNIETRRATRNIQAKHSSEVSDDSLNSNRDTCAYDRERLTEQRITRLARERSQENRRSAKNTEFRAIGTDRRVARNNELRSFSAERADQNRRYTRNYAESRVTERTDEILRDNRNLRSRMFRTERSKQIRRDARNADSRLFRTDQGAGTQRAARTVGPRLRTERTDSSGQNRFQALETQGTSNSRRNTHNFERHAHSLDRDVDYIRDSRSVRLYERALENRRNVRNTEARHEDERVTNKRRVSRSMEKESRRIGRERTKESRLNDRIARDLKPVMLVRRSEDHRESDDENRRRAQKTPKTLQTLDAQENRRVEPRGINIVRSRDDLAQRKTGRAIERLSTRDSLENRSTYTLQRESQRLTQSTSERETLAARLKEIQARNGFHADYARKRESQTMFQNPTHAENETPTRNWQYIFYTVQALYIGGLLMQLNKRRGDKKSRVSWWSAATAPHHLIKVD